MSGSDDNHPFAQWLQPNNEGFNFWGGAGGTQPQPSVFGALPYPNQTAATRPSFLTFRFTPLNASAAASSTASTNGSGGILNSTVIGPGRGPQPQSYFRVRTDAAPAPAAGFTIIQHAANSTPVTIIEWAQRPIVEVRDVISKRFAGEWLALSDDRSYRKMSAQRKAFVWVPEESYITLYSPGLGAPEVTARISREEGGIIKLELTPAAVHLGLLEVCVTVAVLLQCGRTID